MKLKDMVMFLFSKNAGPHLITFDVLFKDQQLYNVAKSSGVFNKSTISQLYNVPEERILSVHDYDAANVIKFTMTRDISSGDFGDRSVFGSQQWAPLLELEIPDGVSQGT